MDTTPSPDKNAVAGSDVADAVTKNDAPSDVRMLSHLNGYRTVMACFCSQNSLRSARFEVEKPSDVRVLLIDPGQLGSSHPIKTDIRSGSIDVVRADSIDLVHEPRLAEHRQALFGDVRWDVVWMPRVLQDQTPTIVEDVLRRLVVPSTSEALVLAQLGGEISPVAAQLICTRAGLRAIATVAQKVTANSAVGTSAEVATTTTTSATDIIAVLPVCR